MPTKKLWLMMLIAALGLFSACAGGHESTGPDGQNQPAVNASEPSGNNNPDKVIINPAEDDDKYNFVTIDDLDALCASYNNLQYTLVQDRGEGEFNSQIYIKGKKVKVVRALSDDDSTAYEYYDLAAQTITTYSSGDSEALSFIIEDDSESLPVLATKFAYAANFTIGETVEFAGETCKILESADGAKMLWVNVETALPVQYEQRDMRGGTLYYACEFRNYSVGTVSDEDVTVPSEIKITTY